MKRIPLLATMAGVLTLSACAASPALPAASAENPSAGAAAAAEGAAASTVDVNDPSRPMFGGGTGNP